MPDTPVEGHPRGASPPAGTRGVRAELFAIVFVTGAAVIAVEILGTRVIGPVFGVSLFIWAALLAVTLGALAVGYYAGGVLVDRSPTPRLVGAVVASAGALLCLSPPLSRGVLGVAQEFGPRVGPLVSAGVLFGPALLALGMVGPIAVRLATRDLRSAGHGVGGVYAISTAGSLLGTFATAFLLVPSFDTDEILLGVGALLLFVGGYRWLATGDDPRLPSSSFPSSRARWFPRGSSRPGSACSRGPKASTDWSRSSKTTIGTCGSFVAITRSSARSSRRTGLPGSRSPT